MKLKPRALTLVLTLGFNPFVFKCKAERLKIISSTWCEKTQSSFSFLLWAGLGSQWVKYLLPSLRMSIQSQGSGEVAPTAVLWPPRMRCDTYARTSPGMKQWSHKKQGPSGGFSWLVFSGGNFSLELLSLPLPCVATLWYQSLNSGACNVLYPGLPSALTGKSWCRCCVSPVFFTQTSLAKLFHFPGVDFLSCYSGEHALEAVTVPEWSETGWGILPGPACLYAVRGEDGTTAQIWGGWFKMDCICQMDSLVVLPRWCILIWEHEMEDNAVWAVAPQICSLSTAHWCVQQM